MPCPGYLPSLIIASKMCIRDSYLSFARWLSEDCRYQMRGPNRQIVHRGPWNEQDPDKYLTEIQIPLEEI